MKAWLKILFGVSGRCVGWMAAIVAAQIIAANLIRYFQLHSLESVGGIVWRLKRWDSWDFRAIVLIPLAEEFIFRGVILLVMAAILAWSYRPDEIWAGMTRGKWLAVIGWQAAVFGWIHFASRLNSPFGGQYLPFISAAIAVCAGLLYGIAVWRTRSLLPGIMGHVTFNFLLS